MYLYQIIWNKKNIEFIKETLACCQIALKKPETRDYPTNGEFFEACRLYSDAKFHAPRMIGAVLELLKEKGEPGVL